MTLSLQFYSLLLMIASGILVGAIIEGTRFITEHTPRRSFVFKYRVILEIIVWILMGLATFYILFNVRDGIWRIYDPLAQVFGILLYQLFFQPVFRLAGRIFLRLVVMPIWFIIRIILTILRKIMHLILFIIRFILMPFLILYKKIKQLALQKLPKMSYNKRYKKSKKR
ncbi:MULTISPECIES: spore cortex biosynthesis protein YabQ [Psychrobacillus]|uniref:Spore cortex biosynthesis protein YabQ n=1 Tax=Psychrobacillus faecigallinarum TaxID=2762235 RepID=A0ABR8REL4_9BACI|nr:spore cortex biosynthesis protein YabQ [Psychrobacillus faecigallinarum]MBD7946254.1 hypothetical protein [Psychrobacillus faecigallinarum]